MSDRTEKTRRLVGLSIFTALVVVLQVVATFVRIGAFPVTLTLVPIVVGAAIYGTKAGAWLGGVFGAVVAIACITGADASGAILWNLNPIVTLLLCLVKGIAAGFFAGLVYNLISRKGGDSALVVAGGPGGETGRRDTVAVACAAVVSPVANTGIFCAGLYLFFNDTFNTWMSGWVETTGNAANPLLYIFLGLAGINFLIELGINLVLSPVIKRIISARRKGVI
ncbi:MAG TPA: ECF transporter S component [Candidatus Scatomorpha intestinavium]|uniref:ECF transporter S component n=1 Tax=Candidatus Scatomorpha intestinavium TaxID=2840922 RepID=A0A9D0ZFD0_9FIRM|nr:ECF transporter S component [Candidatus Scatomorpha intestinavium]